MTINALFLITVRSRRGGGSGGGGGGGDHWEPEDRDRRNNDVCSLASFFHIGVTPHPSTIYSVAVARARHALALVLVHVHGVVRLRPAGVVPAVRDPVVALRAAVLATVSARRRRHSRALSVGQ